MTVIPNYIFLTFGWNAKQISIWIVAVTMSCWSMREIFRHWHFGWNFKLYLFDSETATTVNSSTLYSISEITERSQLLVRSCYQIYDWLFYFGNLHRWTDIPRIGFNIFFGNCSYNIKTVVFKTIDCVVFGLVEFESNTVLWSQEFWCFSRWWVYFKGLFASDITFFYIIVIVVVLPISVAGVLIP